MHYIELNHVCKAFPDGSGTSEILSDLSFTVGKGEFLAVTGPSGSGKSTLLHMLGGLARPSSGDVWIDGEPLYERSRDALALYRRKKAGIVYQFYNLVPELTAEENLILPALMNHTPIDKMHVKEILELLGMYQKRHLYPGQLSGGQQQKIAVGRALIQQPELLLADEPTGNLDSAKRDEILKLFSYLNEQEKMTILLVTHDPAAAQAAGRRICLLDGRIVLDGGSGKERGRK